MRLCLSPAAITFDTSDPASIGWNYFAEQCSFCDRCVQYCPTHAISFVAKSPIVTGDRSLHRLADRIYISLARLRATAYPLAHVKLVSMYGSAYL